jgi:hypothetical protein
MQHRSHFFRVGCRLVSFEAGDLFGHGNHVPIGQFTQPSPDLLQRISALREARAEASASRPISAANLRMRFLPL